MLKQSILIFSFLIFAFSLNAQTYKFKNFGVTEGICDPYVYTINQDKHGIIWIGTGEGLCKFNGLTFSAVKDSLSESIVLSSYKDSDNNLWFGHENGIVSHYDGSAYRSIQTDQVSSKIIGFSTTPYGIVAATQSDGLFYPQDKNLLINDQIQDLYLSSIYSYEDVLLIGSMEGLSIFNFESKDSIQLIHQPEELSYINIQKITPSGKPGKFFLATEDEGAFVLNINGGDYELNTLSTNPDIRYANVLDIKEDTENNLWLSTYSGVYKISQHDSSIIQFDESNGLTNNFVRDVFEDARENIWIGTYGGGIDLKLQESFVFYPGDNTTALAADRNILYFADENSVKQLEINTRNISQNELLTNQLPDDLVTSLHVYSNALFIGTNKNGAYKYDIDSKQLRKFFTGDNTLANSVNYITGKNDIIYIATKNGIYKGSVKDKDFKNFTTRDGLPHNNIDHIYLQSKDSAWVSTESNAFYKLTGNQVNSYDLPFNMGELEFKGLLQSESGIWSITYGHGAFWIDNDSIQIFNTDNGLKSNYCYSITDDINGTIWIGHRYGLSQIFPGKAGIKTYGPEQGFTGDCNFNAVTKDPNNNIYFGTTEGIIHYNPHNDKKDTLAPMLNITEIRINEEPVEIKSEISLPYDIYKIEIDFIGLNYKDPSEVKYKYFLEGEGFDEDYGRPTKASSVVYNNVRDGNYSFKVKAISPQGYISEVPLQLTFKVKLPFWKQWWFILACAIALILGVFVIIKIREEKQKRLQEYLEKELDKRTKEVVEQKKEIEIKNRDITDSINYAQRIQASILPSINKLQENFTGSFVFYEPRDIVSGDFYWFDKVDEDRFIIVCADSTGHGVPGAFMSMIGSTLIKDICSRSEDYSPGWILDQLDSDLNNTLNQNIDAEKSTDGMDIIVCEVNLKKSILRVASAMRPLILYKDGEEVYVKGSRNSIGGNMDVGEKNFEEKAIQLSKGDLIYMFSDGYPDQFGGPMGKKFKMVRLKNMLKDIHQKSMEEQYEQVANTFKLWQGNYAQVDDVLFMGLKI